MSNPYNEVALGTVADFSYGYTAAAQDTGDTRFLRITDIDENGSLKKNDAKFIDFSDELERYQVKKGDILVARTGGTFGKTLFYKDDCPAVYASFLIKITLNTEKLLPYFYFHFSQSNRYWFQANNLVTGGGQPQFNANVLKEIVVPLPPLPEQKAISDLLSTWDEAIEKTEQLIQAKEKRFQWLLRELISKPQNTQKNAEWKKVKLGEICSPVSRKNSENNTNVLTSSAQVGLVSQLEYYNKSVSAENVTGYCLLQKGEFAYNRSSAKGYPYGATKRLDRYEKGVLSTLYLCFALKPGAPCESDFLLHLFESGAVNRELCAVCQEGARSHGLLNITKSDFFGIRLFLPPQDQQKKIQTALNTAQEEIDLLKQLADKYKIQKRGLMQKMLTGEWRVKPEIVNQYMEM
ncbi:MAG: restriction endonuclease subunit S [Desulfobulbus sp.]|jgi:type I restriction enzyme S subunit